MKNQAVQLLDEPVKLSDKPMKTVNTRVYTQKPVNDGLHAQNYTHTLNGLNLTVSTLSGKIKVKTASEAL